MGMMRVRGERNGAVSQARWCDGGERDRCSQVHFLVVFI